jgi:hypothetical protein
VILNAALLEVPRPFRPEPGSLWEGADQATSATTRNENQLPKDSGVAVPEALPQLQNLKSSCRHLLDIELVT